MLAPPACVFVLLSTVYNLFLYRSTVYSNIAQRLQPHGSLTVDLPSEPPDPGSRSSILRQVKIFFNRAKLRMGSSRSLNCSKLCFASVSCHQTSTKNTAKMMDTSDAELPELFARSRWIMAQVTQVQVAMFPKTYQKATVRSLSVP